MIDYHIHALSHGEYSHTSEWLSRFIEKARQKQISEIGFSEHDEFIHLIDFNMIKQLRDKYPATKIKIGLEVDYIPGREFEIKQITEAYDWDYLIGSVHFIDGWAFDHPDHKIKFALDDIDEIYFNYFNLVKKSVESQCFDIVGHLDLIKIWGHKPKKNLIMYYAKPVLRAIREQGMAVEINTSGLRKPVGEIYPAPEIITKMKSMNIPVSMGSDAHHPDQVGMNYKKAALIAKRAGYNEIIKFDHRKAQIVQL